MLDIKRHYIVNEKNQRVAVQLDIETFIRIERCLEDFALGQFIKENDSEVLNLDQAKIYYEELKMHQLD